jgi:uncharacterized membrane protein
MNSHALYLVCVALHLLALTLWLGHMFVWSLITGPAMKRIEPAATADLLRETSVSHGGLGWPALAVLFPTGLYMLHYRGVGLDMLLSGAAFQGPQGVALAIKLVLVAGMVFYQAFIGHRKASIAIYFDMLAAIGVIAAPVVIVRDWV